MLVLVCYACNIGIPKETVMGCLAPSWPWNQTKSEQTDLFEVLLLVIDGNNRSIMTGQDIAQQLQRLSQGGRRAQVRGR